MPITSGAFVVGLLQAVPETSTTVAEHLDDNDGELLLHLLVADLRRFALAAWTAGNTGVTQRCLTFLDAALRDGDEAVQNAVAVSFVEDMGLWEEGTRPFLEVWPAALAEEARRQERYGGQGPSSPMSGWGRHITSDSSTPSITSMIS